MAFPRSDGTGGVGTRVPRPSGPRIAHAVRTIQKRAQQRDARIVVIRELLLVSTETGAAWILDRGDQLAARVARDGTPERIYIRESKPRFAIRWQGDYRLDGSKVFHSEHETGRVTVISGYPTAQLAAADPSAAAGGEEGP